MTKFGCLLKQLREKRLLSQSGLADLAECDHSYVSRLEAGSRMPTKEFIHRFVFAMELEEFDSDRLLIAAGFMPSCTASILADEPILAQIFGRLSDHSLPHACRDTLRFGMELLLISSCQQQLDESPRPISTRS